MKFRVSEYGLKVQKKRDSLLKAKREITRKRVVFRVTPEALLLTIDGKRARICPEDAHFLAKRIKEVIRKI